MRPWPVRTDRRPRPRRRHQQPRRNGGAVRGEKVLVVGCTGQVARPVAKALAPGNEVWGIARFTNPVARQDLEWAGVRCETIDLATPDLSSVPRDFSRVLNFSVSRSGDWPTDLAINAGS